MKKFKNNSARYGMPNMLFKDSDRDGVANVFDCQPHNKKKQDVIAPRSYGNQLSNMYARREQARQQAAYMRQMMELQRLEAKRIAQYSQPIIVIDRTVTKSGRNSIWDPYSGKSVGTGSTAAKNVVIRTTTDTRTAIPGTSTAKAAVKPDRFRTIIRKTAAKTKSFFK